MLRFILGKRLTYAQLTGLLPGYADELAQRLQLIDTGATIHQVRARYLVNARAAAFADSPDFSSRIRGPY